MEFIRVVERLTDVEWINNTVNPATKETVMEAYYSPTNMPFPSNSEGIAAWAEIQAEDAAEEQARTELANDLATIERAETYLTNKIAGMTLANHDKIILRDTLLRMFEFLLKRQT